MCNQCKSGRVKLVEQYVIEQDGRDMTVFVLKCTHCDGTEMKLIDRDKLLPL